MLTLYEMVDDILIIYKIFPPFLSYFLGEREERRRNRIELAVDETSRCGLRSPLRHNFTTHSRSRRNAPDSWSAALEFFAHPSGLDVIIAARSHRSLHRGKRINIGGRLRDTREIKYPSASPFLEGTAGQGRTYVRRGK